MGFKTLDSYGNFCHVNFGINSKKIHKVLKKMFYIKKIFQRVVLVVIVDFH